MSYWSETLEELVGKSLSGELDRMERDLTGLLQPFDARDYDRLALDWEKVKAYQGLADRYLREANYLLGEGVDERVKEAFSKVNSLDRKIAVKQRFVYTSLAEEVLRLQNEASASETVNDIQKQWEALDELGKLSGALEQQKARQLAERAKDACDARIKQLVDAQSARERRETTYASLVEEANETLERSGSIRHLQSVRDRLGDYCESEGASEDQRFAIGRIMESYDRVLEEKRSRRRQRSGKAARFLVMAAVVGAAGYLGYVGIKAASERIDDRVRVYKEEKAESLGSEGALAELHLRHDSIYQLEEERLRELREGKERELEELQRRIASASAELSSMENDWEQAARRESLLSSLSDARSSYYQEPEEDSFSGSLAKRLRPILSNATLTLYIEKSSNTSYLLDDHGTLLATMPHTDAVDPGRKTRAGEQMTPEGRFGIERSGMNKGGWKHDLYGIGFYSLDYRNTDGSGGVLLCSAANGEKELAIDEGRDVMNCGVAYREEDFKRLYSMVGDGRTTQVLIEDFQRRPMFGVRNRDGE